MARQDMPNDHHTQRIGQHWPYNTLCCGHTHRVRQQQPMNSNHLAANLDLAQGASAMVMVSVLAGALALAMAQVAN